MNSGTNSYPTTSDIGSLMRELGFEWSNQAQVYYGYNYEHVEQKVAELIYRKLLGDKPYSPVSRLTK